MTENLSIFSFVCAWHNIEFVIYVEQADSSAVLTFGFLLNISIWVFCHLGYSHGNYICFRNQDYVSDE